MNFTVGICAYNEEKNIAKLLKNLLTHRTRHNLSEIIIIASGCTDRTVPQITKIAQRHSKIKLIIEDKRRGKYSAVNLILKNCRTAALIMTDADCLLKKEAINHLLKHLRSKNVGIAAGRTIPQQKKGFWGYTAQFRYQIFHTGALIKSDRGDYCHISGYLYVLRTGIVKKIPRISLDDLYIGYKVYSKGYKVIYEPKAQVVIKHPTSFNDLFKQRLRTRLGHLRVKELTGHRPSNTVPLHVIPLVLETMGKSPRQILYTIITAAIEQTAALTALLLFTLGYKDLVIWFYLKSAKSLRKL